MSNTDKIIEILKDLIDEVQNANEFEFGYLNNYATRIDSLHSRVSEENNTITEILWAECNKKSDLIDQAIFSDGVSIEMINNIFAEASQRIKIKLSHPTPTHITDGQKHGHNVQAHEISEGKIEELATEYMDSDEVILSFPYTFKRGFKAAIKELNK